MSKTKPFGRRVLVKKERLDVGGMNVTPTQEQDGKKNTGIIIEVGQIGLMNRLFRGIKVGAKIHFKKFFIANDGTEDFAVFVDLDSIMGIDVHPMLKTKVTKEEQESAIKQFDNE